MKIKIDFDALRKCNLFKSINTEIEMEKILICTHFMQKKYEKNEYIILAGEPLNTIGVIINGECDLVKEDYNGNLTIISQLKQGNIFGESIVFSSQKTSLVSITATTPVTVYYLDLKKLVNKCGVCHLNTTLLENLITTISNKNILLNKKISVLSQKTIREKLITYFQDLSIDTKSNTFVLPMSKTKLANYMGIDRSAMSRELKSMQDEGIIDFDKKRITLIL